MKLFNSIRKAAYLLPLRLRLWRGLIFVPTRIPQFANIGEGTHEDGQITLIPTALATSRYLMWTKTAGTLNCALTTTNSLPLGVSDDYPDNASYYAQGIAIKIFGLFAGSVRVITDGTIADGNMCKCGLNGQATLATTGTDSGTNPTIGRALISPDMTANAGDAIELIHTLPTKATF